MTLKLSFSAVFIVVHFSRTTRAKNDVHGAFFLPLTSYPYLSFGSHKKTNLPLSNYENRVFLYALQRLASARNETAQAVGFGAQNTCILKITAFDWTLSHRNDNKRQLPAATTRQPLLSVSDFSGLSRTKEVKWTTFTFKTDFATKDLSLSLSFWKLATFRTGYSPDFDRLQWKSQYGKHRAYLLHTKACWKGKPGHFSLAISTLQPTIRIVWVHVENHNPLFLNSFDSIQCEFASRKCLHPILSRLFVGDWAQHERWTVTTGSEGRLLGPIHLISHVRGCDPYDCVSNAHQPSFRTPKSFTLEWIQLKCTSLHLNSIFHQKKNEQWALSKRETVNRLANTQSNQFQTKQITIIFK